MGANLKPDWPGSKSHEAESNQQRWFAPRTFEKYMYSHHRKIDLKIDLEWFTFDILKSDAYRKNLEIARIFTNFFFLSCSRDCQEVEAVVGSEW